MWVTSLIATTAMALPVTIGWVIGGVDVEMPGLGALLLGALGWSWFLFLSTAGEIRLTPDASVTFRAPVRSYTLRTSEVTGVTAWIFISPYLVTIYHRGGRVRIIGRMDGLSELIATFKTANPSLDTRGL